MDAEDVTPSGPPVNPGDVKPLRAPLNPVDVNAYAARDWAGRETDKQDYWTREFAERGGEATFAASQALLVHMQSVRPDWPSDEERRLDLEHHIELKRAIDRAASVFSAESGR